MFSISTKFKIKCASLISDFLIIFLGDKNRIIKRNNIYYYINLREGIDLGIFLGIKNELSIANINKIINTEEKNYNRYRCKYRFSILTFGQYV